MNKAEHLFVCLLEIYFFLLPYVLNFCPFFYWIVCHFPVDYVSVLNIHKIDPLLVKCLHYIFPQNELYKANFKSGIWFTISPNMCIDMTGENLLQNQIKLN